MLAAPFCFPGWHGRGRSKESSPCAEIGAQGDGCGMWQGFGRVARSGSGALAPAAATRGLETKHSPSQSAKHSMCHALRCQTWK